LTSARSLTRYYVIAFGPLDSLAEVGDPSSNTSLGLLEAFLEVFADFRKFVGREVCCVLDYNTHFIDYCKPRLTIKETELATLVLLLRLLSRVSVSTRVARLILLRQTSCIGFVSI